MPSAFSALPPHERQAFFALLDEYFDSRPHIAQQMAGMSLGMNGGDTTDETTIHQPTSTQKVAPPIPAPRGPAPPVAARKPAATTAAAAAAAAAPTQQPSSPSGRFEHRIPEGLSSGKSIGRMDVSSAGKAFGSMVLTKKPEPPSTAGEAIRGSTPKRNSSGSSRTMPPVPAPRTTAAANDAEFGQAEVLFDYNSTEAEDLAVKRFEIVDLIERVNDDWWKARATDGSARQGIVPSTYVKQI